MNRVQARAANRIEAIKYSAARIKRKLAAEPKSPKAAAWKQRLKQYELSARALDLELATGKPMRIGGDPTPDGVEITPPAGAIKVEGK